MPDEPTMWELKRVVESGHRELSADITQLNDRLSMYVLKEVYEAHRASDQQRIGRLEAQVVDLREQIRRAVWTAVSSFLSPIVVGVVLALILRGG
ncbi:hypothetical protein ABZ635_22100 [Nocardiopsis sp. NPDC007018]|uniref:hypothetical protein n=1 Tax=Nocardiopsis sp. NPDC007018 TaxID=3155721 RepID=UPI0033EA0E8F